MGIFDKEISEHQSDHLGQKPTITKVPQAFTPAEDNCPLSAKTTITLCGSRIGSAGNVTLLVSAPKRGKSAICEALIASYVCPSADTFDLKTHNIDGKKIVYVDGEQSKGDNWKSWRRCLQRGKIRHHYFPETDDTPPKIRVHEEDKKYLNLFNYQCHSVLSSIEERMMLVENTVKKDDVGILILDGLGDFIRDANRADEVTDFYHWLNALAQNHEFTVFGTLHLNPGSDKPRGHLGSEFMRRCEACLNLDLDPVTGNRKLTTDWEYGMVRSDKADNSVFFRWDDEQKMFATCENTGEFTGESESDKLAKLKILAGNLELNKEYSHKDLKDSIMRISSVSEKTAKTRISELLEFDLINKEGKIYKLCTDF